MAAARAAAPAAREAAPLEPCACAVLLQFDEPRQAQQINEQALRSALTSIGVRPSNGEVFVPQEGVFSCAWFFCPSAAAADAARTQLRNALLLERLPLLRGAQVTALERRPAPAEFAFDGMETQFAPHAAAAAETPPLAVPKAHGSPAPRRETAPAQPRPVPVARAAGAEEWGASRPPPPAQLLPMPAFQPAAPPPKPPVDDAAAFFNALPPPPPQQQQPPPPPPTEVAAGWFVSPAAATVLPAAWPQHRPYSPTAATPQASQASQQERPNYSAVPLPSQFIVPSQFLAPPPPLPPPPALPPPPPPGFSTRLPGALPAAAGALPVWSGPLMQAGARICGARLRPVREAEAMKLSAFAWPTELHDDQRCHVTGLLAGVYGPITPAVTPLAWLEPAEARDEASLAAYAAAMAVRGNAPIYAIGPRWEMVVLPFTAQVAATWTMTPPAPDAPRRLLAALLPARWLGRVEAVTAEGLVKASAEAIARPCDSRGTPVALPDVLRLTQAALMERLPRLPAAAAVSFALAGCDGSKTPDEASSKLAAMARRSAGTGKAACALLPPGTGPPDPSGLQEKLWLFPEASASGTMRYVCLLQRDAAARGLLKLL